MTPRTNAIPSGREEIQQLLCFWNMLKVSREWCAVFGRLRITRAAVPRSKACRGLSSTSDIAPASVSEAAVVVNCNDPHMRRVRALRACALVHQAA